ncbi:hypothetical protein KSC_086780 [Ktedonobacter sp. SOSP1-52]|uniref:TOTE conflict system archaeo-eukaryotic primase domain-containing protein n=1 Tax=Ktedonobacter sp. SOSP1-52 TaxID=2778366 RepID=UPI001916A240|nr:CHC2 zinc finger domain-containing protein [Ktedonobacter sp. SOSP1-52]GHO69786.1 hypothetical protein KSC_086780 [Ktedonobacter sp. SOSP1-52]
MSLAFQDVDVLASACIGRRNDYALQTAEGRYYRVGQPLTYDLLHLHLAGHYTLGTYVIDESGCCQFAVFDCDKRGGLVDLVGIQEQLVADGIVSYLEASRRGGHLWVFLASPVSPAQLRRWLLPYCPSEIEFYPKQDTAGDGFGSLIRVPLGVHRLTGEWYPFVRLVRQEWTRHLEPVATTKEASLAWLSTIERVWVPELAGVEEMSSPQSSHVLMLPSVSTDQAACYATIADWCRAYDPYQVIGRYIALDQNGAGCCPFGEHHSAGQDRHPSFQVKPLRGSSLNCWYCYTWRQGGSLFDFLRLFYGVDAASLWARLRTGEWM